MFTGLIEAIGSVVATQRQGEAVELVLAPDGFDPSQLALGESVAIDGTCLTVTARDQRSFTVLAGPETLARTTLGGITTGARVNLERALRASDRLGGHMVSGHVDGVGKITKKVPLGPGVEIDFQAPPDVARYVVEKGSIAVDGISLTVNRTDAYSFAVALIPHTLDKTTLGDKPVGASVNLEADLVGKYVEKFVSMHLRGAR